MKISIEEDYLIYIYLTHPTSIQSVSTITNINGYLLHDQFGNWLGFRIEKSQYKNRHSIELPSVVNNEFLVVDSEEYIDILFVKGVKPTNYYEQECHLDVSEGKIVGVEINRYTWNPIGKKRWILPYKS